MRYYDIDVHGKKKWTSFLGGKSIPGALNVEMDIPVVEYATPMGDAFVRIWGVSLADIGQASDLNNLQVTVSAGFQKGLPLANPAQAGIIVKGYIFQAFGNWIGVDQTLDLVIRAGTAPTASTPSQTTPVRNISLNWKKGTKLADALATVFNTAFPGTKQSINISANVVRQDDQVGVYSDIIPFAQYIKQISKAVVGGSYQGVSILLTQDTIYAFDGTSTQDQSTVNIDFKDLIGQPTWIESPSIQIKTAMRADIKVGNKIKLPPALVTNTASALSSLTNQKAAFQGTFQVGRVRHVGNFRQPDAASWITTIDAFPQQVSS